jgi:hypothetical protein
MEAEAREMQLQLMQQRQQQKDEQRQKTQAFSTLHAAAAFKRSDGSGAAERARAGAGAAAASLYPSPPPRLPPPRLPANRKQFISFVVPDDSDDDDCGQSPRGYGAQSPRGPPPGPFHGRLDSFLNDALQPVSLDRARSQLHASSSMLLLPTVARLRKHASGARPRKRNTPQKPGWRHGPMAPAALYEPSILNSPGGWGGGGVEERGRDGGHAMHSERAMTAAIRHRRALRPVDETGGGPHVHRVENDTITETYEALHTDEPPRDESGNVIEDIPLQLLELRPSSRPSSRPGLSIRRRRRRRSCRLRNQASRSGSPRMSRRRRRWRRGACKGRCWRGW